MIERTALAGRAQRAEKDSILLIMTATVPPPRSASNHGARARTALPARLARQHHRHRSGTKIKMFCSAGPVSAYAIAVSEYSAGSLLNRHRPGGRSLVMAVAESVAPRRGCHRAVARTRSPCARYAAASPTASQSPPPAQAPASAPVRGRPRKADGYADRATGTAAVRYTSVDPAARRSAALHADTRRTEKKRPA